ILNLYEYQSCEPSSSCYFIFYIDLPADLLTVKEEKLFKAAFNIFKDYISFSNTLSLSKEIKSERFILNFLVSKQQDVYKGQIFRNKDRVYILMVSNFKGTKESQAFFDSLSMF
ncbi:MAG: hypothetical protein ACOVOR_02555, partial [Rhabdochlamydiaceae bacterium]